MFPLKKILCPTDFSEPARLAIDVACELAARFRARLLVLHAVSPLAALPQPDTFQSFDISAYLEEMLASARRTMDLLIKEKVPSGVSVDTMILTGSPWEEIVHVAGDQGVDLVVIATHGLTGWRRFVFGSVTEKVVRLSPCPVLTIPAPEGKA